MAQASEHDSRRPDRIEVRFYRVQADMSVRVAIIGLLTFAAGITVAVMFGGTSLAQTGWNTILISAANLCLGIGVASIAFQQRRAGENKTLLAQAESLRLRADALVREYDAYAQRSNTMSRER